MNWRMSNRADRSSAEIADRHYTRQKIGARQFVPPGRCMVLRATTGPAYWVTSWPYAQYVKHDWSGAWICSAFRNEGAGLSSELIRQAVVASRWFWDQTPELGMVTFIDTTMVRKKRDWGRCFRRAGFVPEAKTTKGGLFVLRMAPEAMPCPLAPQGVLPWG